MPSPWLSKTTAIVLALCSITAWASLIFVVLRTNAVTGGASTNNGGALVSLNENPHESRQASVVLHEATTSSPHQESDHGLHGPAIAGASPRVQRQQACHNLPKDKCGTDSLVALGASRGLKCAWSADRGCFAADFTSQVWMKVLGCHGGLTNQRRGVEHLLQTMRRILPQLPEGVDFVLVAPSVWPAFYPPVPPGLDTTVESAQPYSRLFDLGTLQGFVRGDPAMGDWVTGGSRSVTVVETAPAWLEGVRHYVDTEELRSSADLRYPESPTVPCGNDERVTYDEFVASLPTALAKISRSGRMLVLPCMYKCTDASEGWTFPDVALTHASSPAPRLVKMANMFLQVLRTRLGGDGVTFGSAHMRMEFDLCDPARRKYVIKSFEHSADETCRFTPPVVEACLMETGIAHAGDILYVASGNSVLTSSWFVDWKRSSKLKVITKLDVTCPDTMPAGHISTDGSCMSFAELGREEIAAIEVYVLTQSNYFAGAHASSMSHLVYHQLQNAGRQAIYYSNDRSCVSLLPMHQ